MWHRMNGKRCLVLKSTVLHERQTPKSRMLESILCILKMAFTHVYAVEPNFSSLYFFVFIGSIFQCLTSFCSKNPNDFWRSDAKYHSGCGWPSFSKSIENDLNIVRKLDTSLGRSRTEVRCKQVGRIKFHRIFMVYFSELPWLIVIA